MQPKMSKQSLVACLLAFGQGLLCPSFAVVNNSSDVAQTQTNATSAPKANKRLSVTLTQKWSLPFQGQLSNQDDKNGNSLQNIATKELALFKPNKVQTLSLAIPTPSNNNEIADAGSAPYTSSSNESAKQNGKFINGEISVWDGPFDGERIVNHLLESHFENSAEGKKLDAQVKKLGGLTSKMRAVSKDGIEELLGYQGFAPSMRGGQIVLESPSMKIRNIAWAEYVRQRYIDKIHAQVVSSLMQVAEGIGNSETENGAKTIATGKEELSALVGNEEAERAVKALTAWLNSTKVSYATFAQTPWTTSERNKKLEAILTASVEHDPVIGAVTKRVMKYANPGKINLAASTAIQTTLNGITVFSPFLIPSISAGVLQVAYKLSTGGTEQNKLERELLLDKRIQSRLKVLTQESSLALDNYRFALVTKNPPLLSFSQEVLENIAGNASQVQALLSSPDRLAQDYDSSNKMVPEIKNSEVEAKGSKAGFLYNNVKQMAVTDFKKYDD